jgi:hypothetical protein
VRSARRPRTFERANGRRAELRRLGRERTRPLTLARVHSPTSHCPGDDGGGGGGGGGCGGGVPAGTLAGRGRGRETDTRESRAAPQQRRCALTRKQERGRD